jgi:hypothetical protein
MGDNTRRALTASKTPSKGHGILKTYIYIIYNLNICFLFSALYALTAHEATEKQ